MPSFAYKTREPQRAMDASSALPDRTGFGRNNTEWATPGSPAIASTRFGHDFNRIRVYPPVAEPVQAKLTADEPRAKGVRREQEGDRVPGQTIQTSEHQRQRVHARNAGQGAETPAVQEGLRSSDQIQSFQAPVVQRDKAKPDSKTEKPSFNLAEIETIKANAESRHESITLFIRESRGTLQIYKSRLLQAATLYKAAFSRHKAVLDSAKEAAADRKEMISTLAGLGVGIALGVPGAVARMGLKTLAERAVKAFAVGGELTELAVGNAAGWAAGGPDASAFDTTAEIPELKELAVWRTIAEMSDKLLGISLLTAKQMKIVSAAGTAITEISLREGGATNLKKTDGELLTLVNALKSADETSGEVAAGLRDARAEINELGAAPAPHLTVDQVEQNLWIEWIADLTDDDLLDEDDITDHLEYLGVIGEGRIVSDEDGGERREPPRLGVDFGSWVSDADEEDAVNAARTQLGRSRPDPNASGYYDEE